MPIWSVPKVIGAYCMCALSDTISNSMSWLKALTSGILVKPPHILDTGLLDPLNPQSVKWIGVALAPNLIFLPMSMK